MSDDREGGAPRRPPPRVRPARTGDAALVADIHTRSRAATYRGLLDARYLEVEMPAEMPPLWETRLRAFEALGNGAAFIAERDGEPIAFACVFAPDESGSALLNNLHARPDRKGEGAGSALMDAAARWARERGAAAMHLKVVQGNEAAARFYERRGWRFAGTEQDEFGGRASTVLVYRLALE